MRNKKYSCYRHPHTTAEMRANQDGWSRAKRRNLPSLWDDQIYTITKSWKDSRKTQYHINGRGKKHTIKIDNNNIRLWNLNKYFKAHNIPYNIIPVRRFRWIPCGYWTDHKWIPNGKYRRSYYTKYYIVNWWSNKDIGIEYIMK